MTDTQLLTLAIAIIVPLSMLLYSNSRITDTKEVLRSEIGRAEERLSSELKAAVMQLNNKLDHIIETQADHGARLEKLEH